MIHTLFLDLDNTVYPKSSGLMDAIRDRIILYMGEEMHLGEEEIRSVREYSLKKYGTTMIGLIELYGIDQQHYLDFVHDLDLNDFLIKSDETIGILRSFPQRKVIFSNADHGHVQRVLDFLGITEFFDCIIDVHTLIPNVKPQSKAFEKALVAAGIPSWDGCAFIDDHMPNVVAAEKLGIFSILVDESEKQEYAYRIPSLGSLNEIIDSYKGKDHVG